MTDLRRSSIENTIRSAATLYAHVYNQPGREFPRIRFVHDIPFLLQVNFPDDIDNGWRNHSLLDAFGMSLIADLDELYESMRDYLPWDIVQISFPKQHDTISMHQAVITYFHSSNLDSPMKPDYHKPRHRTV